MKDLKNNMIHGIKMKREAKPPFLLHIDQKVCSQFKIVRKVLY